MKIKEKTVKFPFRMANGQEGYHRVRVKDATHKLTITITEADVQKAIDQKGVADPSRCAGAQACMRMGELTPKNGKVWLLYYYTRVYAVTRYNKAGIPTLCVCYMHKDRMARGFDKDPLQLWTYVQKHGHYTVNLWPPAKPKSLKGGKWKAAHEKSKKERAAGRKSRRPAGNLMKLRVASAAEAGWTPDKL